MDDSAPAWVVYLLTQLRNDHRLSLVRVDDRGRTRRPPRAGRSRPFSLYESLDYRYFRREPDALGRRPVQSLVGSPERVDTAAPEVIINLTADRASPALVETIQHGVWQYDHGDGWTTPDGSAFLAHEMVAASRVVTTTLRRYSANTPDGTALYRSYAARDPVSLYRNRNAACWKAAQFTLRRIDDLCRRRGSGHQVQSGETARNRKARFRPFLTRVLVRALWHKCCSVATRDQWFIAIRAHPTGLPTSSSLDEALPTHPPRDRFHADPWLIAGSDGAHVFVEEYVYREGKGTIAVARVDGDLRMSTPRTVLRRPYHLSYPCVVEHDGEFYMVPSSEENRTVDLYRAAVYPYEWVKVATLLRDRVAFDPTIIYHEDRFWMWACIAPHGVDTWDELFVFYSDSLTSGWVPHPDNPVISDVRAARPAGPPFMYNGRLIRPAQSSIPRYGAQLVLNEVELLSPDAYRERRLTAVDPPSRRGGVGVHSYCRSDQLEVFDVVRRVGKYGPSGARFRALQRGRPVRLR